MTTATAPCESADGEWGKPCPACGETLPARRAPRSWKASRSVASPTRIPETVARHDRRRSHLRLAPLVDAVRRQGGNLAAVARDLDVSRSGVVEFVRRHADDLPPDVGALVADRNHRRTT